MVIGIDIDNTITHTTEMIMDYARIFGEQRGVNTVPDPRFYYLEDALGWDPAVADEFLSLYLGHIYQNMRPKEKAVEVIRELKQDHRIILITSRNQQYPQVKEVTSNWLTHYGVEYDRLILNATDNMHYFSKLAVCQENQVQIMIEDHHDLVREISAHIPVIMFDYPYNSHLNSANIVRVQHWNDVRQWVRSRLGRVQRINHTS